MPNTPVKTEQLLFVAGLALVSAIFAWQVLDDRRPTVPQYPPEATKQVTTRKSYSPVDGGLYSADELGYFQEVAFGSEHVHISPVIRKWTEDINVRIEGEPTGEDLLTLKRAIDLLNQLQDEITLKIDYFQTSIVISFQPESTFVNAHAKYQSVNPGFFWVRWIEEEIYSGTVLIDSEDTQAHRNAMIAEELTQALGLMNHSSRYPDSIFNDAQIVANQTLSLMDKKMVTMLYRPELKPGMSVDEALTVLSELRHPEEIEVP